MSTKFLSPGWRMPRNANQSKFSNYSMDFDGSQHIDIGSDISVSGNCTVSFWFKSPAIPDTSSQAIFARFTGLSDTDFLIIGLYLQGVLASNDSNLASSKTTKANITLVTDTWYHCVVTKVSGVVNKIYIDGTDRTGPATNPGESWSSQASNSGFIGQRGYGGKFIGQIDALAIFDYALSSSQVTTLWGGGTSVSNPMALPSPPIAYYPLGESAGGFVGGSGTWLIENNAIGDYVFDFANSNIEVDSIGDLFSGITNFSFSGWFNLTSFGSQQVFNILEGSNWKFGINTYNNQLRFNVNPGVAYIANLQNITSTNTWFHYAGVFDGSGASDTDRLKLYINGQPQTVTYSITTPTSFPTLLSTADISIGGTLSPFNGMTGKSSNIKLWTSSLTPSEVETLYNYGSPIQTLANIPQSSNLQGWWKLNASDTYDSSTGNWTITDHSSNSNNGTSSGMSQANLVQSDLQTVAPYSKYAMDFDASSSDYIQIPYNVNLTPQNGNFTISAWINTDNLSGWHPIWCTQNLSSNTPVVALHTYGNKVRATVGGSTNNPSYGGGWALLLDSTQSLTTSTWYHITVSYNMSGNAQIYVNGNADNSGPIENPQTSWNTGDRFIGEGEGYWDGRISNLSIWNTDLTSSQVTEIYNQGLPSNLNSHSAYSNLISWWQLGENSSFDGNDWIVADEKGTNNGTSTGMPVGALVNGVGTTANGVSTGMSEGNLVGDAPYSTANALSTNMVITSRVSGVSDAAITTGGTGYVTGTNIATTGGSGTNCTINITTVSGGVITAITINNGGSNYVIGDVLTISGGNGNATITVSGLNTP